MQKEKYLSEIIAALEELGGIAPLNDIYNKIKERNQIRFINTWQASIRRTIQLHSSDSDIYNTNNADLFFSVAGKGAGIWGLRIIKNEDINEVKAALSDIDDIKIENMFQNNNNYDLNYLLSKTKNNSRIEIKEGLKKTRILNQNIINYLKKFYKYKCQLCNSGNFENYGYPVVEAHHIEPFSKTQNNKIDNIVIVCPTHHRLLHIGNAIFDKINKEFILDNNKRLKLILNKHL